MLKKHFPIYLPFLVFFSINSDFNLISFPFSLTNSFCISYSTGLQTVNFVGFCLSEEICISSSQQFFLMWTRVCNVFPTFSGFQNFEDVPLSVAYIISGEKPAAIRIFIPLYVQQSLLIHGFAFHDFSYSWSTMIFDQMTSLLLSQGHQQPNATSWCLCHSLTSFHHGGILSHIITRRRMSTVQ